MSRSRRKTPARPTQEPRHELPPEARADVASAFARIMQRRHPQARWTGTVEPAREERRAG